eukprot:9288898-Pyramimonas_sp.AAC.1
MACVPAGRSRVVVIPFEGVAGNSDNIILLTPVRSAEPFPPTYSGRDSRGRYLRGRRQSLCLSGVGCDMDMVEMACLSHPS